MTLPNDITLFELYILKALNVVGWFWHHFSFIPWYIVTANFAKPKCGTLQAKSISGLKGGPYRNIESLLELRSGFAGCQTIDSLFKYVFICQCCFIAYRYQSFLYTQTM